MSNGVTLADIPQSASEFEDYVTALFQASRHFVEKNIVERDFTEILELDCVATSYENPAPGSVLVEAKSGSWGFPDIFKVVGWMRYLGIDHGAFFASKEIPDKDPASVHTKVAPLGVTFVHLGDCTAAIERFAGAGFPNIDLPLLVDVWRFAYWMERRLIKKLRAIAKSVANRVGPRTAIEYHGLINNGIFFVVKEVSERLVMLCDAFQRHPKLSLGVAREMQGHEFDPDYVEPDNAVIREAMYRGAHDALQACFYIEHRARLALLKGAIDYITTGGAEPGALAQLPASFRAGLARIRGEPAFRRYALFWQVFLWGFGGFYLADRQDQEFEWLAHDTGVPVGEIPRALAAFDALFPPAGDSWLTRIGPSQCVIVKMVPTPFQGLGAYHRVRRYGVERYNDLGYADYTYRDLVRWNNAAVHLLAP